MMRGVSVSTCNLIFVKVTPFKKLLNQILLQTTYIIIIQYLTFHSILAMIFFHFILETTVCINFIRFTYK